MEVKLMRVTPPMAREWLKKNTINRPLRNATVAGLVAAYQRNEYVQTHQGIAFDVNGNLLDGQHRLHALGQMPDSFAIEVLVTRGLQASAFEAIDIGVKRSNADVLRVSQGQAAVARFMASIIETHKSSITPHLLVPYLAGIESTYARLIDYAPTISKTWSSAAMRSAAILRMLNGGDADYILLSYHALVHSEFDAMSPVVQALFRQQTKGLVRSGGFDLFARAYKAFDYRKQSMDKIQINDSSAFMVEMRDLIQTRVLGQRKAANTAVAAKKVNGSNSTRKVAA